METQDFRMAKWFPFKALGFFHTKGNPMKFLSSRKSLDGVKVLVFKKGVPVQELKRTLDFQQKQFKINLVGRWC